MIIEFKWKIHFDQPPSTQVLLKKCIGRLHGNFLDLIILQVGKWHTPFWIALSNCTNIQKNFLEKVDYRGRYSSVFKMGTALGKRAVANSIFKPHPCKLHHFETETWWSHPENLSLIVSLVPEIFNLWRLKVLLKSQFSASLCTNVPILYKGKLKIDF